MAEPNLARQVDIEIARTEMLRDASDDGFRVAGTAAAATARRLNDEERFAGRAGDGPERSAGADRWVRRRDDARSRGARPARSTTVGVRADLLCMKSAALYWSPHREERVEAGLAAFDMAREVLDAASMSRILSRSWTFLDASKPNMADISDYSLQTLATAEPGTAPYMSALEKPQRQRARSAATPPRRSSGSNSSLRWHATHGCRR